MDNEWDIVNFFFYKSHLSIFLKYLITTFSYKKPKKIHYSKTINFLLFLYDISFKKNIDKFLYK